MNNNSISSETTPKIKANRLTNAKTFVYCLKMSDTIMLTIQMPTPHQEKKTRQEESKKNNRHVLSKDKCMMFFVPESHSIYAADKKIWHENTAVGLSTTKLCYDLTWIANERMNSTIFLRTHHSETENVQNTNTQN